LKLVESAGARKARDFVVAYSPFGCYGLYLVLPNNHDNLQSLYKFALYCSQNWNPDISNITLLYGQNICKKSTLVCISVQQSSFDIHDMSMLR